MLSMFYTSASKSKPIGCLSRLYKISTNHNVAQVAFMTRLALKEVFPKPPPFPYWKKKISMYRLMGDPTSLRYDENTRIIVVDGPPAIGKTELCQRLAKEFGLLYMPPPTHDQIYVDKNGYDKRVLNPKLPQSCRACGLKEFLEDPNSWPVAQFQFDYLMMRIDQYINAMLHVLATGQGVILNRSMFSDIGFVYAMHRAGYLSKEETIQYEKMRDCAISYMMKPHLFIYLDAPPDVVSENIKRRGNPDEVNSKVFTKQYISDFKEATTDRLLIPFATSSEILIYDWSKKINHNDIIYDIEALDLDPTKPDKKFGNWVFLTTSQVIDIMEMCQKRIDIYAGIMASYDCKYLPRLAISDDDDLIRWHVYDNTKEMRYALHYNPFYKDNYLFQSDHTLNKCRVRLTPGDFVNFDQMNSPA